jgi:hypothetical protein
MYASGTKDKISILHNQKSIEELARSIRKQSPPIYYKHQQIILKPPPKTPMLMNDRS